MLNILFCSNQMLQKIRGAIKKRVSQHRSKHVKNVSKRKRRNIYDGCSKFNASNINAHNADRNSRLGNAQGYHRIITVAWPKHKKELKVKGLSHDL